MKLTIPILAMLAAAVHAQNGTVIQKAITDFSSPTLNATVSGPLTNIGQATHLVIGILSSKPSHTCDTTSAFLTIEIEGSPDKVNWIGFATPVTATGATSGSSVGIAVQQASGLYANLRIFLVIVGDGGGVNCQANVWYNGAIAGWSQFLQTATDGAITVEKGARTNVTVSAAAGSLATKTVDATGTVDCVTGTLQVQTDLAAPAFTTFGLNLPGPAPVWQAFVGFPTGTLAGASQTVSICGLNQTVLSGFATLKFGAALTSVAQSLSYNYFQ